MASTGDIFQTMRELETNLVDVVKKALEHNRLLYGDENLESSERAIVNELQDFIDSSSSIAGIDITDPSVEISGCLPS